MAREMKDSGIVWIGSIPESWTVGRIGKLYTERKEKVSDIEYSPLSVTMKGVMPQLSTAAKTDAHDDRKLVCKGDFAINSRSDRRGSCGISPYDGSVSLINTILIPRGEMHPVYYDWLFHSTMFSDEFYKWGHGIVDDLWTTNWQDMKKIFVPMPPYQEQECIAAFLDVECARIDAVIEQTRTSIEEYKKLKQAVITQAVTKGIRPNRQMKDIGVEWIGEIPSEWKTTKIKYISSGVGDGLHAAPEFEDNGLYYFINGNNLGDKQIRIKDNTNSVSEAEFSKYKQPVLCSNAILIALNGTYGLVSFYNGEKVMLGKSAGYINLFPTIKRNYVRYALLSDYSKRQMNDSLAGTTIANVSLRTIKNLSIAWPSEEEQEEISLYLDSKCPELDRLLEGKAQLINELEQYKKTLIYEYVTGKKEVPA